jgi:hypothetical protein
VFDYLEYINTTRKDWRYQSGNQKPYIKEEKIIQLPNEKWQKVQTLIHKTLHKKRTYCFYRGIEGNKLSVFEIKRSSWYWKCHLAQGALWCSLFSFLYTAVLSFRPFSFDHCIVCLSSIYGLWLHFWYRQPFIMVEWYTLPMQSVTITTNVFENHSYPWWGSFLYNFM